MSNAQILIVEDEALIALDLQDKLEGMGYFVSGVAGTGPEALQKVLESQPDLILMDIMLKGSMDGVEAARRIHSQFDIPIVYLTAYSDHPTLQRAKQTEPFGYLLKPFKDRELQVTLEVVLYKHNLQRRMKSRERWFASILKSVGEAIITTDPQGSISFMNPAAEALTGWSLPEAMGKGVEEVIKIVPHAQHSLWQGTLSELKETQRLPPETCLLRRQDQRSIPLEGSLSLLYDENTQVIGRILALRDVTEVHQAKTALHKAESEIEHHRTHLNHTEQLLENLLTARERQMLQLIVDGFSTKAIADQLNISSRTVEAHRYNLMRKLNVQDIPTLVRQAILCKLVTVN